MKTLKSLLNKQLKSNVSFRGNNTEGYLFDKSVNISHFDFDTKQSISTINRELTRIQPSVNKQTLLTLDGKGDNINAKDSSEYKIKRLIFKLNKKDFILPIRFLSVSRKHKRSGGHISIFKHLGFMSKKSFIKRNPPTSKHMTCYAKPDLGIAMTYIRSLKPKLSKKVFFTFLTRKELKELKELKKSKER